MEKTKFYETICNNHNQVLFLLSQIKKTGDLSLINEALEYVRYCKKQGQHMENRLKAYKNAILDLGFERVGGKFKDG